MALSDKMEKRMNEILVNAQEMLAEIDVEVERLEKEIKDVKGKKASIENLRKDALAALGITEQESGNVMAEAKQEFDLDSQFDQELDIS